MDSFSKRRPPKFSEPIDFNLKSSESFYSNFLVDRFNGLFSSGWSTNDQNSSNGVHGGLYSSNITHATNGNVNPFNTKGLMSYDYNNKWIAPPRSCPPIGTRDSFGSFSTPQTRQNNNNTNNSYVIGNNNNNNQTTMANNNGYNNLSLAANSNLNAQQGSYVPPRVRRRNPSCTECVFCKNNGHPPSFYKGHILKCPEGKVICPVLREYDCPICHNGGGEKAHTLRYCPWNKPSFWQRANR